MPIDPGSPNARLMFRALGVTQRLVKKIGNGGTLQRDELRAGELATQALRACIADPGTAHRQELLVVEAERLAPRPPEPPRDTRRAPHDRSPPRPGAPMRRGGPGKKKPARSSAKPATVTVKKKPRRFDTP